MKALGDLIAYLAVILNIYLLAVWLYVFHRFDMHAARQTAFNELTPALPYWLITVFLLLFSVASLIILSRKNKFIPKVLAVLQSLFIFLWIWQYL